MSTIYGLTGGIGMGKTTAARLLAKAGLSVIDSDDLAREVVQPGQPALDEIRAELGDEFIGDDGNLDRAKMAEHVFNDRAAREKLEAIIHPRVRERWQSAIAEWRTAGESGVVVIPLLFEVAAAGHFDAVLCVACTDDTQRERLRERGWSDEQIGQRIAAQLPIAKKMERADHVIWNEGTPDALRAQLTRVGCVSKNPP